MDPRRTLLSVPGLSIHSPKCLRFAVIVYVHTGDWGGAVRLKFKHEIHLCFMYDSYTSLKKISLIIANHFVHENFMVWEFSLVPSC